MSISESLGRQLRTDAVDFSFGEIVNLHNDREIVIAPEYQRLFRWSDEQKSRLIESILIELPIPPIFLIEDENGVLELIDGLQRISSVIQFMSPEAIGREPLILVGCDLVEELNGRSFEGLTLADRLRIKRTAIRAIVIRRQSDNRVKYELFKRLNTGGSLLSPQEIRNCSSRMVVGGDKFYGLLQTLASDANFRISTGRLPETDLAEKADEELVLRFFTIKNYVSGYHGNVKEWLDAFMEGVLFDRIEFDSEAEASVFRRVFAVIAEKFGKNGFARHRDGVPQGRLAPAYFEATVGAVVAHLDSLAKIDATVLQRRLAEVFESEAFGEVTGPGANTIAKLKGRIEIVSKALSAA